MRCVSNVSYFSRQRLRANFLSIAFFSTTSAVGFNVLLPLSKLILWLTDSLMLLFISTFIYLLLSPTNVRCRLSLQRTFICLLLNWFIYLLIYFALCVYAILICLFFVIVVSIFVAVYYIRNSAWRIRSLEDAHTDGSCSFMTTITL